MTVTDRTTLRSVILPAEQIPAERARQLLNDLGHDVSRATSPDDAMCMLRDGETDLLIVDVTNSSRNKDFIDRLPELPQSSRPRELAIFSDWIDENLEGFKARISPSHVHVFLKPLHMHGLLNVLRHLDEENEIQQA